MNNYADLEIRILGLQSEGYPVELTLNYEQEFPGGYLDPDWLPWVASGTPAEDGERLFAWLFADERIKNAWAETRGQQPQRRIRLRIDAAAPELHTIPWELLRDPGEGSAPQDLAAGTATPFSRYLAGRWQPGAPILQRPIKILVAIANPDDLGKFGLSPVDIDQEWDLIQKATEGQEIQLTLLQQPCTLPGMELALKDGFHIIHFVGHGAYHSKENRAVLFMADEANQASLVPDQEFAGMLARQLADATMRSDDKPRLVFLASCQTAERSPADAFRGLAPQLVAAGMPAVLAMQELVPVDTARQFAATFYRRLLKHGLVDLASNEARSSVISAGLAGEAIPVLFSRLRGNRVLGQRGRISSAREKMFWPFLLENVLRGQCTPFLGPGVTSGLLPDRETVARKLAEKYGYPLRDPHNLVRVAQFMDIYSPGSSRSEYQRILQRGLFSHLDIKPDREQKERFKNATFTETAEALAWAERVLELQENETHHLLADLRLPLYVTTNFDNFMYEALKHKGTAPRRVGPRWQQPEAGSPQYVLTPKPTPEQPVVFHLNGHDGDPEQFAHLVLSEDDYLAHVVRLSRDQETILPANLLGLLSSHSFIFLGFQLDDWEFRS
ncbi:MAG TPA: CHAT domain-containing protein, partial [Anaerolineales bacterium]